MSNILPALSLTFTPCACGARARHCALNQMAAFVDGQTLRYMIRSQHGIGSDNERDKEKADLGPLVGRKRGFKPWERIPFSRGIGGRRCSSREGEGNRGDVEMEDIRPGRARSGSNRAKDRQQAHAPATHARLIGSNYDLLNRCRGRSKPTTEVSVATLPQRHLEPPTFVHIYPLHSIFDFTCSLSPALDSLSCHTLAQFSPSPLTSFANLSLLIPALRQQALQQQQAGAPPLFLFSPLSKKAEVGEKEVYITKIWGLLKANLPTSSLSPTPSLHVSFPLTFSSEALSAAKELVHQPPPTAEATHPKDT